MTDSHGATGANVQTFARRIIPTIGRAVWFWASLEAKNREGSEPNAALIAGTFTGTDTRVNLAVFNASGEHFPATSVQLLQEGDEPPTTGSFCEWMPFQKGQAARTEQLAAKLAAQARVRKGSHVMYRDGAGHVYPAIVTRIFEETGACALKVFRDDSDSMHSHGAQLEVDPEGTEQGWFWHES